MTPAATTLALMIAAIIVTLFLFSAGWLIDRPEPATPRVAAPRYLQAAREARSSTRGTPGGRSRRVRPAREACGACQAGNHDECFGGGCSCCGDPPPTRTWLALELSEADAMILRTRTLLAIGV